jgi:hypothetical protein
MFASAVAMILLARQYVRKPSLVPGWFDFLVLDPQFFMTKRLSLACFSLRSVFSVVIRPFDENCEPGAENWLLVLQNEKATRQLGRPFLSRENSSNGG